MSGLAAKKAAEVEAEALRALAYLASAPDHGASSVTTAVFREMLLRTGGWMMAAGYSYDIIGKSLGAGVQRVTLRRRS